MAKKNKSLQKFTDIQDEKSLDEFMKKYPNTTFEDVYEHIMGISAELVKSGKHPSEEWQEAASLLVYCAKNYGPVEKYEFARNSLYQFNHIAIIQALHDGILKFKTMPTITNIAQQTGLSRTSVHKHLKDIKDQDLENDTRLQQRALVQEAVSMLYRIGMQERNPTALKYFIQFADPTTRARTVNNYVQINNMRLTQESIKGLPPYVLTSIEEILTPYKETFEAQYQPNQKL